MRIAIAGGGPGGLYLSILLKRLDPSHEVVVYERNAPDDTFGFGVVFSDETLGSIEGADRVVHERMEKRFASGPSSSANDRSRPVTAPSRPPAGEAKATPAQSGPPIATRNSRDRRIAAASTEILRSESVTVPNARMLEPVAPASQASLRP